MNRIGIIIFVLIESSKHLSGAFSILSPYAISNKNNNNTRREHENDSSLEQSAAALAKESAGTSVSDPGGSEMAYKSNTNNFDLDISLFMGKKEYEEYLEFIKNGGLNFSYDDTNNESRVILFTQILPSIIIYSLTFLVGFFGNLLVLVAIFRVKKLQSATNLFLFSLATADLILICACVPIKIVEFLSNEWIFGRFMCKIFHYIQNLITICSVMNLTGMSLERYIAILHPLRAKYMCTRKRIKMVACCIWIFSFIAALPILYGKEAQQIGNNKKVYICKRVWNNDVILWRIFEVYRSCLILFIPLIIIIYTYTQICIRLWRATNDRKALTEHTFKFSSSSMGKSLGYRSSKDSDHLSTCAMNEKGEDTQRLSDTEIDSKNSSFKNPESRNGRKSVQIDQTVIQNLTPDAQINGLRKSTTSKLSLTCRPFRNKSSSSFNDDAERRMSRAGNCSSRSKSDDLAKRKQIVKMLICIVCIFFISWAPITINNLLVSFGKLPNVNGGALWYIRMIFYLMSYVNSCLNPIVYGLMSTNFRDAYKQIFSLSRK